MKIIRKVNIELEYELDTNQQFSDINKAFESLQECISLTFVNHNKVTYQIVDSVKNKPFGVIANRIGIGV